MKVNSIIVKSVAITALSLAGITALNSANLKDAQAATVKNDTKVVTVNYVDGDSIKVWDNYKNPQATGQKLPSNSSWKVIKTAYDSKGHKWYDLGKKQWVKAEYVNKGHHPANVSKAETKTTVENTNTDTKATNVAVDANNSAKQWIANRESGGSYDSQNGQYVGKYQLSAASLNGDYSPANQERTADNYVNSRYGSWEAAKTFWQANGWY